MDDKHFFTGFYKTEFVTHDFLDLKRIATFRILKLELVISRFLFIILFLELVEKGCIFSESCGVA